MFELSDDQSQALQDLLAAIAHGERVLVLTGPAGAGKTELVRVLVERLRSLGYGYRGVAPTGKAAVVLSRRTGERATTIHGALYSRVKEKEDGEPMFLDPQAPCDDRDALVCDEASMVDRLIHQELLAFLPESALLVYVGDHHQLPPVKGRWGPDFEHPTAKLTRIHRQAEDSPILSVSQVLREGGMLPHGVIEGGYERRSASLADAADWLVQRLQDGTDCAVLGWTNDVRQRINRLARYQLGRTEPLQVGDRLLIRSNNHKIGIMNGEVYTLLRKQSLMSHAIGRQALKVFGRSTLDSAELDAFVVELLEETTEVKRYGLVHTDLLGATHSEFKNHLSRLRATHPGQWIHCDYGYGLTVHSAQGSQFNEGCFVIDSTSRFLARKNPDQARRLTYTAVTRFQHHLLVADA